MRIIGLTGGIASGKTTVQRFFAEHGAHVLDADAVYHDLIRPTGGGPSELARAIATRFAGVLEPDGALDRHALGARVFADPAARSVLDRIAHPAVRRETTRRLDELARRGVELAIYDVPLLFEVGLEAGMDGVIVVWTSRENQLARLMARNGLDRHAAEARVDAQLPLDEKRRRATWVIDSSGSFAATRAQVAKLWRELSQAPGPKRAGPR